MTHHVPLMMNFKIKAQIKLLCPIESNVIENKSEETLELKTCSNSSTPEEIL